MILASFCFFLAAFLIIGLSSVWRSRGTKDDYYLASRSVSPPFVALSAVATNNSGYMFIGIMGFTYTVGLSAIWLMIGWILGDFLASLFIHRNLRIASASSNEVTFAGTLATWNGRDYRILRVLAALITLVFLGAYAAAQLSAGGKALEALFGWPTVTGAIISAIMVALYCMAGGIRASIWTDVAQSAVMLASMAILAWISIAAVGGLDAAYSQLDAVPGYFNWFPEDDLLFPGALGAGLFIFGWLIAGMSVIGQPHIMIRFMALENPEDLRSARAWYYGFFILFYVLATIVGLMTKLHIPDLAGMDPELVLPTMALELLPGVLVGMMLAGIFAATMSTADSLVLSCSSALSHDLLPQNLEKVGELKTITVGVTAFALAIAIIGPQSVFSLVILAWSVLGAAFGPLLILYATRRKVTEAQAVLMILAGTGGVLAWRAAELQGGMYEGVAGMAAGFAVWAFTAYARQRVLAPSGD